MAGFKAVPLALLLCLASGPPAEGRLLTDTPPEGFADPGPAGTGTAAALPPRPPMGEVVGSRYIMQRLPQLVPAAGPAPALLETAAAAAAAADPPTPAAGIAQSGGEAPAAAAALDIPMLGCSWAGDAPAYNMSSTAYDELGHMVQGLLGGGGVYVNWAACYFATQPTASVAAALSNFTVFAEALRAFGMQAIDAEGPYALFSGIADPGEGLIYGAMVFTSLALMVVDAIADPLADAVDVCRRLPAAFNDPAHATVPYFEPAPVLSAAVVCGGYDSSAIQPDEADVDGDVEEAAASPESDLQLVSVLTGTRVKLSAKACKLACVKPAGSAMCSTCVDTSKAPVDGVANTYVWPQKRT